MNVVAVPGPAGRAIAPEGFLEFLKEIGLQGEVAEMLAFAQGLGDARLHLGAAIALKAFAVDE